MKKYQWNLEKCLNHVQKARIIARPNTSFMEQLKNYEKFLKL